MQNLLQELYTLQGKSERIKNFPYPRQFASLNFYFVWIFLLLIPFGIMHEFHQIGTKLATDYFFIGKHFVWLSIPFSIVVSWVFHTMELIGDTSENPFEGLFNDVPITALTRAIEIDMLEMLDEENVPDPLKPMTEFNILM